MFLDEALDINLLSSSEVVRSPQESHDFLLQRRGCVKINASFEWSYFLALF
jgi:hypothetical protein